MCCCGITPTASSATRRASEKPRTPLDSPEFLKLKARLPEDVRRLGELKIAQQDEESDEGKEQLGNRIKKLAAQIDQLKQELRATDLTLRQEYFHQRKFTEIGGYLLLFGLIVALVAAKTAAVMRRKLPSPLPQTVPRDADAQTGRSGRPAVVALGALLAAAALALSLNFSSELPADTDELAAMLETEPRAPVAVTGSKIVAKPPSDEEVRKNWPRFRGPNGSGISPYENVPVSWNAKTGENILWKTRVPLPGNNSPVVWADRVFLSGADRRRRVVYCFDANTGKMLWQKDAPGNPQGSGDPPKVLKETSFAAPTVATDGRVVCAVFPTGDLAALDIEGNRLWTKHFGTPVNEYGHATSLAISGNVLVVQLDQQKPKRKTPNTNRGCGD